MAFPDFRVAVLVGTARIQGIVDMECLQMRQAHNPLEFSQHPIQVIHNIITAVVDVAGVQTDTYFGLQLRPEQSPYRRQFLKPAADFAAFSRHGF